MRPISNFGGDQIRNTRLSVNHKIERKGNFTQSTELKDLTPWVIIHAMINSKPKIFYAHSGTRADLSDGQPLSAHLTGVANLAKASGQKIGIGNAAALAGELHDVGKANDKFPLRLLGKGPSVEHSIAGASIAMTSLQGGDAIMRELVAYAVAGHHAGLPDKFDLKGGHSSLSTRIRNYKYDLHPLWKDGLSLDISDLSPSNFIGGKYRDFGVSIIGRMLFSCLVDADYRDTSGFYSSKRNVDVDDEERTLGTKLGMFRSALDRRLGELSDRGGPISVARGKILQHVTENAKLSPGMFTMTVPTGGGKTLAGMSFALDHAARYGKDRIIYVSAFTSVIEQTAGQLAEIFGTENVLEHHSSLGRDEPDGCLETRRTTGTEDWNSPVVVTTNVQFFESLFSSKPSKCRKLKNIANSVIILDEAQTLPRGLMVPCVAMLDELARNYGCSIVLCTATQPALNASRLRAGHPLGLNLDGRELGPAKELMASLTGNITLKYAGLMDDASLVAELSQVRQGMVIVNSRRHALDLYREAFSAGLENVFHLSTRQTARHRALILGKIKALLAEGEQCHVVATSLVEAGVDISFQRVWRAEAGLEQIIQACGRCNRERLWPAEESIVTVFEPKSHKASGTQAAAINDMRATIRRYDDVFSDEAIEAYFKALSALSVGNH